MYRAPRGTSDIMPGEQAYWRYVERIAVRLCELYGYGRIDTPTFEDVKLFSRSIGEGTDIVEKEMYIFEDKGGNQLTLRPEGTAPVCRAYLEHGMTNLPQPVRLYYLAPIYRYERPQAGRYREHYQFGCEALGDGEPTLDAEVIDMAWQFFTALGLRNLTLKLNSIGCRVCRPDYLAALENYYTGYTQTLCKDCKVRLEKNPLRLLDCKKMQCKDVAQRATKSVDYLCPECGEHFIQLRVYLERLGLPYEVNHCLVRGLDYYTRTVFEVQPESGGGQSTLGGGGRYDDLISELGGKSTPAIGFASGMERIILNLKKQGVNIPSLSRPRVLVAYVGDKARDEAVSLTARLRRAGIGVVGAAGSRSLKAQLRQANALDVSYAVIIGDEEIRAGTVILRDMTTSDQETLTMTHLEARLITDLERSELGRI